MSSKTKAFGSQKRRIRRNIPESSEGLSTMPLNSIGALFTTRTISILQPRTSLFFINTGGRWSCSSNGSSSIFRSNDSGESPRMQSAYRFTLQSSHTASLPSSSMTSRLADQSLKSCVSLASLHSPWTASKTCSNLLDKRQRRQMIDSFILTDLINIY